jgi:hypothetical protein
VPVVVGRSERTVRSDKALGKSVAAPVGVRRLTGGARLLVVAVLQPFAGGLWFVAVLMRNTISTIGTAPLYAVLAVVEPWFGLAAVQLSLPLTPDPRYSLPPP